MAALQALALAFLLTAEALPVRPPELSRRPLQVQQVEGRETRGKALPSVTEVLETAVNDTAATAQFLRMHASIFSDALMEGLQKSARHLQRGELGAAGAALSGAVVHAQADSDEVSRSFQSSVPRLAAFVMLVFGIGCLWGLEALLTLRSEEAQVSQVGQESYHFPALGTLRFLMSLTVLLYNFYPWSIEEVKSREAHAISIVASWGVLAAPLFFTLSGFCQSHAKMAGSKAQLEEDAAGAAVVRIMAWYPYYVISLIFLGTSFFSYSAWDWSSFAAQIFLVSGGFEEHSVAAFPYMPCSWWFSLLGIYTLGWYPMHMVLQGSPNSVIWTMFTVATAVVIPSVLLEYFFMSDMPLFALIQYSPCFFFGQSLAVWQVQHCMLMQVQNGSSTPLWTLQPVGEMPFAARFGVTASVLILGLIMIVISPFDELPLVRKPCCSLFTKGLLLPVFGMLIVGLCNEADPLARLAARPLFALGGKLSLSIFLLSMPIHMVVRIAFGNSGFSLSYVALLLAASVAGYFLIEVPSRRFAGSLAIFMTHKVQK